MLSSSYAKFLQVLALCRDFLFHSTHVPFCVPGLNCFSCHNLMHFSDWVGKLPSLLTIPKVSWLSLHICLKEDSRVFTCTERQDGWPNHSLDYSLSQQLWGLRNLWKAIFAEVCNCGSHKGSMCKGELEKDSFTEKDSRYASPLPHWTPRTNRDPLNLREKTVHPWRWPGNGHQLTSRQVSSLGCELPLSRELPDPKGNMDQKCQAWTRWKSMLKNPSFESVGHFDM